MKYSALKCIIVGDGEMMRSWQTLSMQLGLADVVEWTGEIRGQTALSPHFCEADVFVYPGRIGLSLVHAFAYGLPVVLNDNGYNQGPEYIAFKPGENGWSFKEGDVEDLASKVSEALDDMNRADRGLAGQRYVLQHYSMDNMVDNYCKALECAARLS